MIVPVLLAVVVVALAAACVGNNKNKQIYNNNNRRESNGRIGCAARFNWNEIINIKKKKESRA